jgi:protein-tyrosine phosphatase
MIDTHSHILPGLDDGSRSLEQSLAMAREAAETGVTDVVCTPHLRDADDRTARDAPAVRAELQELLDRERVPLRLHPGFEITFEYAAEADPEELRPFSLGAGTRFVLVEIPHFSWPVFAAETIHRLRLGGLVPVLAHPERNERIQSNPELLASLLHMGALAQGTTASFFGLFGRESRRCLLGQLAAGQVAFMASDAHYRRRATWSLKLALDEMATAMPLSALEIVGRENPGLLLQDGFPEAPPPIPVAPSWRRGLRALFGRR